MKKLIIIVTSLLLWSPIMNASIFDNQEIKSIDGETMDLNAYKGKTILFVNIATKCGYTPQLKGLETLYQENKDKNFLVVGLPSNDFGGQTPEVGKDVKKFCALNYGVTFPLTEKLVVKGDKKHPFVAKMIQDSGDSSEIGWNFEKFLVDKKGKVVKRFKSSVKPDDKQLVELIQQNT